MPPLADSAAETLEAAGRALDWIALPANAERVGPARAAIERALRRGRVQAARIRTAAGRPMAVAVFGPSQNGKSHLISVLARTGASTLCRFDGEERLYDFIAELNSDNSAEATGLVTRFAIARPGAAPSPAPPGRPVRLRLHTHADIVKILANGYVFEGRPQIYETLPGEAEILEHLAGLPEPAGEPAANGLTPDDVWDIQDYFDTALREFSLSERLGPFWERAAPLAPRLSLEGLGRLFSILWGRHAPITRLYLELVGALAQLGFLSDACAPLDALVPRTHSILDVVRLQRLGSQAGDGGPIELVAGGRSAYLARPVVTALTAELTLTLAATPQPFFEQIDLLDFPGYRARGKEDLGNPPPDRAGGEETGLRRALRTNPGLLGELFLRGKVEYLFQRYVADQEITAMLLCVKHSNMEATSLSGVIRKWIETTHGGDAAERARFGRTLLFFVLTMFDHHLEDTPGVDPDDAVRFDRRIAASLIQPFGQDEKSWVRQWLPGRPFDNVVLMRKPGNPNAGQYLTRADGEDGPSAHGREVAVAESFRGRCQDLRAGFLRAGNVRAHVADPARAFDEMLRPDDGGVGYIAERLTQVCDGGMKAAQLAARLGRLRRELHDLLHRFHISSKVEDRIAEGDALANRVFDAIDAGPAALGRFGNLLRGFQIDAGQLADHLHAEILRAPKAPEAAAPAGPARPGVLPQPGGVLQPGGLPRPGAPPAGMPAEAAGRPASRTARFAEASVAYWVGHMRRAAGDPAFAGFVGMPEESLRDIATALDAGARRLDLVGRIAALLDALAYADRSEHEIGKATLAGSHLVNRFVSELGYDARPPAERPVAATGGPIFTAAPVAYAGTAIPVERADFGRAFMIDWVTGFFDLVQANARSENGQTIDVVQNRALGEVLARLRDAG